MDVVTKPENWDYKTVNTKELTHGIHPYPAMMIPQIAKRLIYTYGNKNIRLFDPYCGSGTTLLEGMIAGIFTIGTDLNPLARLIARVKTRPLCSHLLKNEVNQFKAFSLDKNAQVPNIPNINYWFSIKVQKDLASIKQYLNTIKDKEIKDVFRIAFSSTIRKVSFTRSSQFKLHRISQDQINNHNPNTLNYMIKALFMIYRRLEILNKLALSKNYLPEIHGFNSVESISSSVIMPGTVDLVVTSPPYGDSRTTVAYGQFSRLSLQWLDYSSANQIDNSLMGGKKLNKLVKFNFPKLDRVIDNIAEIDQCRAREVSAFFSDYKSSIKNVSGIVKKGGYVCYVTGDRTVKGYQIPLAETTIEFFKRYGILKTDLFSRNIPNKRMPSLNSPSNIPGKTGKTMTQEKIIICQKVF